MAYDSNERKIFVSGGDNIDYLQQDFRSVQNAMIMASLSAQHRTKENMQQPAANTAMSSTSSLQVRPQPFSEEVPTNEN